jgi:anti-sigma regulatory factor (Ser/Thr protein kinase)
VGGLGLHLALQLAVEARYAREQGCNCVWVVLATGDGADPDQGAPLPR